MIRGRKPRPVGLKLVSGGASRKEEKEYRRAEEVCGQPRQDRLPCKRKAGWGTDRDIGPCRDHLGEPGVDNPTRPPPFLPGKARELWERIAPRLERTGRLEPEDLPGFMQLCLAYHMALYAGATLLKEGIVDTDSAHAHRKRKHPAWQMWRDAQTAYRHWAGEFGMTPVERARFDLDVSGAPSKLERLIRGD